MLPERATRSAVIVSDAPMIINQICGILLSQNYGVVIEKSTIKGVARLLEQDHDFIILDVVEPKDHFIDIIGIIRKMRPRLPILALTDDHTLKTQKALSEAGAFYFILKPINSLEIENVVATATHFQERRS